MINRESLFGEVIRLDPLATRKSNDIPTWLSYLVVVSISIAVPLSIIARSNQYATSPSGFADGGDLYSHFTEALHVRDLVRQGITNFWYDGITLGYPLLLAYQPLPVIVTSATMLLLQRYITAYMAFRWLLLSLLTAMPWTWYLGTQWLRMTRLQSSIVVVCLFWIRSWANFGLELEAFRNYGLYSQAYGMVMLPLAVGSLYRYVIHAEGSRDATSVFLALNLLSHSLLGLYVISGTACLLTSYLLVTLASSPSLSGFSTSTSGFGGVLYRAADVHGRCFLLSWWWLVPGLIHARYVGGLPWKSDTNNIGPGDVTRRILCGDVYDYGRALPVLTLSVLAGFVYICLCYSYQKDKFRDEKKSEGPRILYVWLIVMFLVTLLLFMGRATFGSWYDVIPFHSEVEALRYLNGLHFCGLLLSAVGLSCIIHRACCLMSRLTGINVRTILISTCLVTTPFFISAQMERTSANLSVSEVSDQLRETLRDLREYPLDGRLYAHMQFETGGPWELALIPYLSGKPGIMTYSRGFHDSLSAFYLESYQPDLDATPWFPHLMRLLNIRYVAAHRAHITDEFIEKCELRILSHLGNDSCVFVRSSATDYGYFEFVKVPGFIRGDLKGIRTAVVTSTRIYTAGKLLAINPLIQDSSVPNIVVNDAVNSYSFARFLSFSLLYWFVPVDGVGSTWKLRERPVTELEWLDEMINDSSNDDDDDAGDSIVKSVVLKGETVSANEYSAVVDIPPDSTNKGFYRRDHLLLKVTFHPYWTCRYAKAIVINNLQQDAQEHTDDEYDRWTEVPVHHVTPNLMSLVLPPGKHHVICSYHNPLYQKVGFLLFVLTVLAITIKEITVYLHALRTTLGTYLASEGRFM